jgi:hypothetical protein
VSLYRVRPLTRKSAQDSNWQLSWRVDRCRSAISPELALLHSATPEGPCSCSARSRSITQDRRFLRPTGGLLAGAGRTWLRRPTSPPEMADANPAGRPAKCRCLGRGAQAPVTSRPTTHLGRSSPGSCRLVPLSTSFGSSNGVSTHQPSASVSSDQADYGKIRAPAATGCDRSTAWPGRQPTFCPLRKWRARCSRWCATAPPPGNLLTPVA